MKYFKVIKNEYTKNGTYVNKDYGDMSEDDMKKVVRGYRKNVENGCIFYERKNTMSFFYVRQVL